MFFSEHRLKMTSLRIGKHRIVKNIASLRKVNIAHPYRWAMVRCLPRLHQLLKTFAESRVVALTEALSRSQGWEAGPGQLGKVMGDIRRAFSVTIARANAMCLLERLSQLGPGAGAAAKRRQVALRLEERRRQDRQAFDLAWQARGASRVGRAFIQ